MAGRENVAWQMGLSLLHNQYGIEVTTYLQLESLGTSSSKERDFGFRTRREEEGRRGDRFFKNVDDRTRVFSCALTQGSTTTSVLKTGMSS